MSRYKWTLKNYDLDGNGVTAASTYDTTLGTTNTIQHAEDRQLELKHIPYDIDTLSFSLYLDDPMALQIERLQNVVKLWRTIYNDAGSVVYEDPADFPCFAGVVGYVRKAGQEGKMQIQAYSPLWRLKFRFHLLNHYLKINPDTSADYTTSEVAWKIIDLVNNAFGAPLSFTGISQGSFLWGSDPTMAPYFIGKGTNSYSNIFESVLARSESPEIVPEYFHDDGDPTFMIFNTDNYRGTNRFSTVDFRYRTGTNDNLEDLVEEGQVSPGEFANYYWAVGQGGPNSGKIATQSNQSTDEWGYDNISVYMAIEDFDDIKLYDNTLIKIATGEFNSLRRPPVAYSMQPSPTITSPLYGQHYLLGDLIKLNGAKGALTATNAEQRIYNVTLNMSNNNIEIPTIQIGDDLNDKIP